MRNTRRFFLSLTVSVAFFVLLTAGQAFGAAPQALLRHSGPTSKNCRKCHKNGYRLNYNHIKGNNGFFVGRHATVKCAACHAGETYFSRRRELCEDCHLRPAAHFGGSCRSCHSATAWTPATGAHKIKLLGRHKNLKCAQCHRGGRFTGLSWRCRSCHKSRHNSAYGANCRQCHGQRSWLKASMNHRAIAADCSACHKAPDRHFSSSCKSCHNAARRWSATFNHPGVGEHSYKTFPCNYCHPKDYASYSCTRCHKNGAGGDD